MVVQPLECDFLPEAAAGEWRRIERLLVDGDVVVAWIVLGGTLVADGQPFEAEVCDIFEVRNDLIRSVTVYADRTELSRRASSTSM